MSVFEIYKTNSSKSSVGPPPMTLSLSPATPHTQQTSWSCWLRLMVGVAQMVKRLQCRSPGFDPWVRRSPGEGHGNSRQYSCLENPMVGYSPWGHRVGHDWVTSLSLFTSPLNILWLCELRFPFSKMKSVCWTSILRSQVITDQSC